MESILIFIAFVVISSLFNKDKKGRKSTRRDPNQGQSRTQQQQQRRPTQPKTARRSSGGVGDLFKDLKSDFDDVFKEGQSSTKQRPETYKQRLEPAKETPSRQQHNHQNYEYENQYQQYMTEEQLEEESRQKQAKKEEKTQEKVYGAESDIYTGEIGIKPHKRKISFDRESVTRGIIMAEVLGKPKSMKR